MSTQEQQDSVITLEGDDGHSYSCQVLDIFTFEGKEYAMLLNLGGTGAVSGDADDEGSIVVMHLSEKDDQSIFQTIESVEEFERVIAHVEDMVKQAEESGEESGED